MIKIIADIGATNSRWLISDGRTTQRLERAGYNAVTHERDIWRDILVSLEVDHNAEIDAAVYGAGFNPFKIPQIEEDFRNAFPNTSQLFIAGDLLGSCRGMAGQEEAIIVIMGTGSNSCHYKDGEVAKRFLSGGYILGDEGSASALGRAVIRSMIREKMPAELTQLFGQKYDLQLTEIINRIHQPQGGQYMGQFAKFASDTISHPWMRALVLECLSELFTIVSGYQKPHLSHYFTGSIAVNFPDILAELCAQNGIGNYKIVPDILDGLARYHGLTNSSL